MARVTMIYPPYRFLYTKTPVREGAIFTPPLNLGVLAAAVREKGHDVRVIDLNWAPWSETYIKERLAEHRPDAVAITATTPLYPHARDLARWAKAWNPEVLTVIGGAHASSLPAEAVEDGFDVAVVAEGDYSFPQLLDEGPHPGIAGIAYRDGAGNVVVTEGRGFIHDLDPLPFPAWDLFDVPSYRTTDLLARANPAGWIETSRGCVYGCTYCNKSIFGRTFRVKSARRTVDEMAYMLEAGFQEIHLADDSFTTDIPRVHEICAEIGRRGMKFPWATVTGIRADLVTPELLRDMKAAGCYRVYFGIESGDDGILKAVDKGDDTEDMRRACRDAKAAGLETFGFFMMGLPDETEATLRKTIDFAKSLDLDMAKVSITVPLPSTPLFNQWDAEGRIKTKDWTKYNLYHPAREIYDHPTCDWDTIERYFKKFYREFYFRPSYVGKRLVRDIRRGTLLADAKMALRTKWW